MTDPKNDDPLMDLPALVPMEQVAGFFHVDVRTIRRWVRRGRLRVLRTTSGGAGRILVEKAEVRRLLESMREPRPFGAA